MTSRPGHPRGLHDQRLAVRQAERDQRRAQRRHAAQVNNERKPSVPRPPARFKEEAAYTVDDVLRRQRSRGTWQPESAEYLAYVAEVHRAAGLAPESEESGEPSTVGDHLAAVKSRWFR